MKEVLDKIFADDANLHHMAQAHLVLWQAGGKQFDVQNTSEIETVNTTIDNLR